MSTITLPLLLVEIDRSNGTIIPTKVPEHEIPILKVVHGASAVRVLEEDVGEEIELDVGADSEFRRLQRKYRRINAPDLVVRAFPMGAEQLRPAGFKSGSSSEGPAQSAVRVHPSAKKPESAKKSEPTKDAGK